MTERLRPRTPVFGSRTSVHSTLTPWRDTPASGGQAIARIISLRSLFFGDTEATKPLVVIGYEEISYWGANISQ